MRSATRIAGHRSARLSGEPGSTSPARAPEVQPPLPDEAGPQNRLGMISSVNGGPSQVGGGHADTRATLRSTLREPVRETGGRPTR